MQTASYSASASGDLTGGFGRFLIRGNGGYTVASIDSAGNATYSGELTVPEILTQKLHIPIYTASGSASPLQPSIGSAVLPAGQTSATVTSDSITDQSVIFITPTSPTTNTLYVVDKSPGEFIVGTTTPQLDNVTFNWWIIN